jgi:hypothetical protein
MAPYGSAIKAWPSGQIMATSMITPRWYAKPVASGRLAASRERPRCGRAAEQRDERAPLHSIPVRLRTVIAYGRAQRRALWGSDAGAVINAACAADPTSHAVLSV